MTPQWIKKPNPRPIKETTKPCNGDEDDDDEKEVYLQLLEGVQASEGAIFQDADAIVAQISVKKCKSRDEMSYCDDGH